jgi:serine/threonine protein kinase
MSTSREDRLERALEEALALHNDGRAAFIDRISAGDDAFRERLIALLMAAEKAPRFFDQLSGAVALPQLIQPLSPDTLVAHFRILRQIGAGGMGLVYLAEDLHLQRQVALKFLPPHLAHQPEARKRFLNEARLAAGLDHPNIGTIYETGESDGRVFIAMAFIEGKSLKERIKEGPLPIDSAVDMARQIAEGLNAAHARGIIHRDIKPGNVMLTPSGLVKVMDFGLAKRLDTESMTRASATFGTVAYMSPEQARGEPVDHRTDIWSLGVVFYEMLTGERPFKGENEQAVIYAILNTTPAPLSKSVPGIPSTVEDAIALALMPAASDRMADAAAFLDAIQDNTPTSHRAVRKIAAGVKRRTRNALYIMATLAAIVSIIAAIWHVLASPEPFILESVAVLPVENASGQLEQDYLADGITDELITRLGVLGNVKVIARSSVMQYRAAMKPAPDIGRELNVRNLIESTLLRSDDSLRISARLIDAASGVVLSTFQYTAIDRDLMAFQQTFVSSFLRQILGDERMAGTLPQKNAHHLDEITQQLYLKGNFYFNKSRNSTTFAEDLNTAASYFEQVLARDSSVAEAHARLGYIKIQKTVWDRQLDPDVAYHARKAVELEPQNAMSQTVMGMYAEVGPWDWEGAEARFKRALEINPTDLYALNEYAVLASRIGKIDVLSDLARRMTDIDPASLQTLSTQFNAYLLNGEYDKLLNAAQERLELLPNDPNAYHFIGKAYQGMKRYSEAEAAYQRSYELLGGRYIGPSVGCMFAQSGQREKALEVIDTFASNTSGRLCHRCIFSIYTCLGDKEQALHWAERLVDEAPALSFYISEPVNLLKDDPRFQKLMKRVNLDVYQDALMKMWLH